LIGLGFAVRPLTDGGPKGLGRPVTENGDCATEVPAEKGVVEVEAKELELGKDGTGGSGTFRSTGLLFETATAENFSAFG
jgi:hypothetical protein